MEQELNTYFLLKCIVIGDVACGKSCITRRFTTKQFIDDHDITIGVDFDTQKVYINNTIVKLQIWDTAGQESFRCITRSYYKSSEICILLYDVTKRQSFDNILEWHSELIKNCSKMPVVLLVGNKIDLRDSKSVTTEEGEALADKLDMLFMECSAKDGTNIDDMFYVLTKRYIEIYGLNNMKEINNLSIGLHHKADHVHGSTPSSYRCNGCI